MSAVLTASVLASAPLAPASAAPGTSASPGSAGLGDPLFPSLGNGGYDVTHYDLSFDYDAEKASFRATTVIEATTTQALFRFDLDFAGNSVARVTVDGRPARFARLGEELVVTPRRQLPTGRSFRTVVTYTGRPVPYQGADPEQTKGFFPTEDGFFVAPQPDAAHSVFPANDHPSDKATITFHLTTPVGLMAAANGVLSGVVRHGTTKTWTWQEREPIATELVTMAVGRYTINHHTGPHGLPLRDVVPVRDADGLRTALDSTAQQISWLERRLGRYPFSTYGLLAVDADIGFAEENQTLTVFRADWLAHGVPGYPDWAVPYGAVHELTHQWFGDSVTPQHWSDVWLNEGPATFYGYLYVAQHGGPSLTDQARSWYAQDQLLRDEYGPPAAPRTAATLYSDTVYNSGALTLYALRDKVGDRTFDAIMRAWLSLHRHGTADTADFIHTASSISGKDLTAFLHDWLYGPTTPALAWPATA
ncbi:M1 family metallopeptidase [Streptomyces sp. NPDC004237]|uniref:M1 family metallopeptidase n=1 Tax=Streptomyces sp. NPDC004237 TaxID=3154455 RepID=UPI0033A13A43